MNAWILIFRSARITSLLFNHLIIVYQLWEPAVCGLAAKVQRIQRVQSLWMTALLPSSRYLPRRAAGETCLTSLVTDVRRVNGDERRRGKSSAATWSPVCRSRTHPGRLAVW